jgi:hypothetical protein
MTSRTNQFWIAVVVIWLIAIGLTGWNLSSIDAVALTRDQNERLRKEMLFHRQYIGKLETVRQTADALFLPVDSVKLGYLSVQSDLQALSAVFGLEKIKITRPIGQVTDGQLPITVSFEGSFEGALQFLSSLREYPYLPINQSQIKVIADHGEEAAVEISLYFQYRLKQGNETPPTPMRTTRHLMSSEVSPS